MANEKEIETENLYKKGIDIIESQISFLKYLKISKEITNLKKLLLSDEQLLMFDLISKPELSNLTNDPTWEIEDASANFETLKNSFEYFKKLDQNQLNIPEIDKKLINMMDDDLWYAFAEALNKEKNAKNQTQ